LRTTEGKRTNTTVAPNGSLLSGLMAAALSGSTAGFGTLGVLRADAVTCQMGKNAAAI
jgi:hypothetical protein